MTKSQVYGIKICIPVREQKREKMVLQIRRAAKAGDFVEIWFDKVKKDIANLIHTSSKPVIAVCRGRSEKGDFRGTEQERVAVLEEAARQGAALVDCGLQTPQSLIKQLKLTCKKHGAKLIISHHIWKKTPSLADLKNLIKKAKGRGADIIKVATFVKKWRDNITLFEVTRWAVSQKIPVIVVGMGPRGKISRIGCPLLGSFLTYVALDEKSATAPGQWTLSEVKNLLRIV